MANNIAMTSARLADPDAMGVFLSAIPNAEPLGRLLANGKALSTRAYDDDTQTARFVFCDATTVRCFTVTDITIDQAEMIAAACELVDTGDAQQVRDAVDTALGGASDMST